MSLTSKPSHLPSGKHSMKAALKRESKKSVRQEIKTITRHILDDMDEADNVLYPVQIKDICWKYW